MPDSLLETDDAILVKAVLKGDKLAFRKIIFRHEKLVVSIVGKIIHRQEDREDLCQDVFLKVYEKLHSFKFQAKLSTWIGSIAYNTCLSFLKKRKLVFLDDLKKLDHKEDQAAESTAMQIEDSARKPDELLLDEEKQKIIQSGINSLPVIQKTVLGLFHHQELSLQEIADVTGLPLNTIKSHLFRARKQLMEEMSKY